MLLLLALPLRGVTTEEPHTGPWVCIFPHLSPPPKPSLRSPSIIHTPPPDCGWRWGLRPGELGGFPPDEERSGAPSGWVGYSHISAPADGCAKESPLSALPGEPKFLPSSRAVIGSWWSLSCEWKCLFPACIFHRLRDQRDAGCPWKHRAGLCGLPSQLQRRWVSLGICSFICPRQHRLQES